MAETPNPPVDYLSRDYRSLRADLLAGIPSRVPEWTSRNTNDFGIALLELFAYVGDTLHYYIDRTANESFLATASQRASVLSFARLLDYRPVGSSAASVQLVFANSTTTDAVVPKGTRVATATLAVEDAVYFETQTEITVPARNHNVVTAIQGITVALEEVGTSDGSDDQDFTLAQSPVIEGSVQVSVTEAGGAVWTFVEHLLDAGPNSTAFGLYTDERDRVHVLFGDNVNGKIPAPGAVIRATYRVGGGTVGNVGPGQLTRIVTTVPAGLTVANQTAASGGVDAESIEQIKINAPRSLFALQRAVTSNDYAVLATQVPAVAQARVISVTPRVVTIFVVPRTGGALTPELAAEVRAYLEPRKQVATTVVVEGPTYVPTNLRVKIEVLPQFVASRVQQSVLKLAREILLLDNVVLGDRITLSDVHRILGAVPGVNYLTITELTRAGTSPEPASLDAVFRAFEVPTEGTVEVLSNGGIAG